MKSTASEMKSMASEMKTMAGEMKKITLDMVRPFAATEKTYLYINT
jgi:hypothetical protein